MQVISWHMLSCFQHVITDCSTTAAASATARMTVTCDGCLTIVHARCRSGQTYIEPCMRDKWRMCRADVDKVCMSAKMGISQWSSIFALQVSTMYLTDLQLHDTGKRHSAMQVIIWGYPASCQGHDIASWKTANCLASNQLSYEPADNASNLFA